VRCSTGELLEGYLHHYARAIYDNILERLYEYWICLEIKWIKEYVW
jgi:hypothetical protein